MNPLMWIRLGAIGLVLAILAGAYWYIDRGGYNRAKQEDEIANQIEIIKQQEENHALTLGYAKRLTEVMKNGQKMQDIISDAEYRAGRVQVSFPSCPVPGTPQATTDSNEASRVLSERVDTQFGILQSRATVLFSECEAVNKQAIQANQMNENPR